MRIALSLAFLAILPGALGQEKSEFKYLPDHPGKASATVSLPPYTE